MLANERGLITGFIIRMILGLIVMGILLFDAGAIVVNVFSVDSVASEIAAELSVAIGTDKIDGANPKAVRQEARRLAKQNDAKLVSVEATASGAVQLKVRKEAPTLIVSRVAAIEDWGIASADGRSSGP